MQQFLTIIVLLLLIGAAAVTLFLDARQRRIDRQVAIALSTSHAESVPSIRRAPVESRWLFFHRLANYKAGISYDLRPEYVLLAGAIAAAAIFYANSLLGFPILYVSLAAVIVAVMVVRGLFGWQRRRLANQLFRQLPDTIEMVTSAVRSGLPVNEAFRAISREMPQPTAGQFAIVCSELSSRETSGGSCRRRLSANASGGVWIFCGDTWGPDEVGRRFGRNLADIGRHRASARCAGCSREGSGGGGDLFLTSAFIGALRCRRDTIQDQSADQLISCSLIRLEGSSWPTQ